MRSGLLLAALAAVTVPLAAQEGDGARPDDWVVRFDSPGQPDSAVRFVAMPPGWHITTGPRAIFYHPGHTAEGSYRVESELFLFDPKGRNREAYGILFGGQGMDGDGISYSYFLIRNTGDFLVKRRDGSTTTTVRDWASSAAIVQHAGGDENARNVLAVGVGVDEVEFFINGEKVAGVPRSELQCDGVVGLRVNHALDLHVSSLDVTGGE